MSIISNIPFPNFVDGQDVASGSQVNANNASLISQINANSAHNGNNSDITGLSALTSPPSGLGAKVFTSTSATSTNDNDYVIGSTAPTGFTLVVGNRVTFLAVGANTGAMTLNVNGTGALNLYKNVDGALEPMVGAEWATGQAIDAFYDGTQYQALNTPLIPAAAIAEPTYTILTLAGGGASGNYSPPPNCKRIEWKMIAPAGGGGGNGGNGGNGGATSFGGTTVNPGNGGKANSGTNGGAGGAASGNGTDAAGVPSLERFQGAAGNNGGQVNTGSNVSAQLGVCGASSYYGGGGAGALLFGPGGGSVVPGAGGGAPAASYTAPAGGGPGGGGAGECAAGFINAPVGPYPWVLGAAGVAGVAGSGSAGGVGGISRIKIKEFYS